MARPTPDRRKNDTMKWSMILIAAGIALLCVGCEDNRENLLKDLQSSDENVRIRASEQLAKNTTDAEVGQLCVWLRTHQRPEVRGRCASVLGYIKAPAAVPVLIEALSDPTWYVRRIVVDSLRIIGDERAAAHASG